MTPLDRGQTSPSSQQDAQASSSQPAGGSLQANIANVGAATVSQPVTIPVAANISQFQSVLSSSHLIRSPEGDLYYLLNASNEQARNALSKRKITLGSEHATEQVNAHIALLDGIRIPVFTYKIRLTYMVSRERLLLQSFIKEIFTRLEGQTCYYDRVNFISSLLILGDRQRLRGYQTLDELVKIIETYIPNPVERKYAQSNLNICWPNAQEVRQNQNLHKLYVDRITPEIKKRIYLKMDELERAVAHQPNSRFIKRIYSIDAAFAYGSTPGVMETWIREGRVLHQKEMEEKQSLISEQIPKTVEQQPSASAQVSLVPEQLRATTFDSGAAFNPGTVVDDDQIAGSSRGSRTSSALRFEPYQRPRSQPSSLEQSMLNQARALGLTPETLEEFNLNAELDAGFKSQMEALPWPRVTSSQYVRNQNNGMYVIAPATSIIIGRFIIEHCPPDARVYRFAALRYGVSVGEIASWVSEASN